MKIALISLNQKWEDKNHNLFRCQKLIEKASYMKSSLAIFPEMTLTGFSMNTKFIEEDFNNSPSISHFKELSQKYNIWIIAGIVFKSNQSKSKNSLIVLSPSGKLELSYTKIHPFTFAGEEQYFEAGNCLSKMQIEEFKFGFSICYDLRFPELFSSLSKECDVLINIANWPKKRIIHWKTLLQARAIENQTFMIGVNRTGTDGNGLIYIKSSKIASANGDFLKPISNNREIDIYELNKQDLIDFKIRFSTYKDRRLDVYRQNI